MEHVTSHHHEKCMNLIRREGGIVIRLIYCIPNNETHTSCDFRFAVDENKPAPGLTS